MRYLFIILLSFSFSIHGQLLKKEALDTCKVFTSLEEALRSPEQVYRLDLSRNKHSTLPKSISQFVNLNELILRKNKLTQLPESLGALKYLQYVDISKNQFDSLPEIICSFSELRVLKISVNAIKAFPESIGNLTKLEYLDAYSNELSVFPSEMKNLINIKEIDFRVISISEKDQARLTSYFPKAKVHFSNSCNCGF